MYLLRGVPVTVCVGALRCRWEVVGRARFRVSVGLVKEIGGPPAGTWHVVPVEHAFRSEPFDARVVRHSAGIEEQLGFGYQSIQIIDTMALYEDGYVGMCDSHV